MATSIRTWRGIAPEFGQRVYVDADAIVIGQVKVGDDSSFWPGAVVRGDTNTIAIGARTSVQDACVLHVTHAGKIAPAGHALMIGDDVTIGHRVTMHGCTVGNRCLIGIGSILLDGVRVDDEVIIGAGALVTPGMHCARRGLYVGSPARRMRELKAAEIEAFSYQSHYYVRMKDEYLAAVATAR
jgi:carbonic anhydrase/acetyltransferase-like protein (isoleucine patch superfamily)